MRQPFRLIGALMLLAAIATRSNPLALAAGPEGVMTWAVQKLSPVFERRSEQSPNQPTIQIGRLTLGEMSQRPQTTAVGADLFKRSSQRHPHYAVAHAREYDAENVQAMDIEGIDVAILYGTRGRQVLMHDDLDPQVADALTRAHNKWTHDYCQHDPKRLKFRG